MPIETPSAAELRQWQTVTRPSMQQAVKYLPRETLARAAELGGQIAGAELAARGQQPIPGVGIGAGFDPGGLYASYLGEQEAEYAAWIAGLPTFDPSDFPAAQFPAAQAGIEGFNGIETGPLPGQIGAGGATPVLALPALGGIGALTIGLLRQLWLKYGPTIIKALVGGAAFSAVMKLIMGDSPDATIIDVGKLKRRKRYTIGANPRVGTLQKVSRHVQRLLKRHEKVIREFMPKKQARYGIPPAKALSAIERAAIRGS